MICNVTLLSKLFFGSVHLLPGGCKNTVSFLQAHTVWVVKICFAVSFGQEALANRGSAAESVGDGRAHGQIFGGGAWVSLSPQSVCVCVCMFVFEGTLV